MIVPASGIDCDAKSTTANFCSAFTETILGTVIPNSWGAGCACVLVGTGDVRLAADGPLAHPRKNSAAAELMITTRVTVSSFRFIWSFMTIIPETGAPGVIRTRDRRIRNPMLYPTELQAPQCIFQRFSIRFSSHLSPAPSTRARTTCLRMIRREAVKAQTQVLETDVQSRRGQPAPLRRHWNLLCLLQKKR